MNIYSYKVGEGLVFWFFIFKKWLRLLVCSLSCRKWRSDYSTPMTNKTLNKMKTNNSWFCGKEIRENHSPGAQKRQADTGKCSLFEQSTGRTLWNYCQNGQLLTCWRLSVAKECKLLDHPVGGRPPSCLLCHQLSWLLQVDSGAHHYGRGKRSFWNMPENFTRLSRPDFKKLFNKA